MRNLRGKDDDRGIKLLRRNGKQEETFLSFVMNPSNMMQEGKGVKRRRYKRTDPIC